MDFLPNIFSLVAFLSFQMQIGLPITGKYRDPEADMYYNNNDVSWVERFRMIRYFFQIKKSDLVSDVSNPSFI